MRRLLLVIPLLACAGEATEPHLSLTPASLQVTGDLQTAQVASELPNPIVVKVLSAESIAVPNQLVTFHVVQGGGSVFSGAAMTNAAGEALERWTLGTVAGEQILEARAIDQETGDPIVFATVKATAEPGPLAYAGFEEDTIVAVGDSIVRLLIQAVDAYGNAVANPVVTAVDALPVLLDGEGYSVRPDRPGVFRYALGNHDTLRVFAVPPAGTFSIRYPFGGYTWHDSGRLVVEDASAPGSIGGWRVMYRAESLVVVRSSEAGSDTTRSDEYSGYAVAPVGSPDINVLLRGIGSGLDYQWGLYESTTSGAWRFVMQWAGYADTLRVVP